MNHSDMSDMATELVSIAARELLELIISGTDNDFDDLFDTVLGLKVAIGVAQRTGTPEADIEDALEGVRRDYPCFTGTWRHLLQHRCIDEVLENMDWEKLIAVGNEGLEGHEAQVDDEKKEVEMGC